VAAGVGQLDACASAAPAGACSLHPASLEQAGDQVVHGLRAERDDAGEVGLAEVRLIGQGR
jgi:hypothetical protein